MFTYFAQSIEKLSLNRLLQTDNKHKGTNSAFLLLYLLTLKQILFSSLWLLSVLSRNTGIRLVTPKTLSRNASMPLAKHITTVNLSNVTNVRV